MAQQTRGVAGILGGDEGNPGQDLEGALADVRQIAHGRGHHV